MADLNSITNAAGYVGNAALGGAGEIAINTDTKPIQQLAAYTVMYNRSQYEQRQKDADQKIKELGALAPYDLVNGIEKDATELKDAQAKLTEYMAEFASKGTPKSPKEKIQQQLDFQKKIADQIKLIDGANARKIKLDAYRNATQADTKLNSQQKELKIKQAEQLFNNTDIYTLPSIPENDISIPKIGEPVVETVNYLRETPNGMIDEKKSQWSFAANDRLSYLEANNLDLPVLPPNATQQQKNEYEQKRAAFEKSDIGVWKMAEDAYANALNDPNYKKTETTSGINVTGELPVTQVTDVIDIEKIKRANPIVGGILSIGERYNKYAQDRIKEIQDGGYVDRLTGEKVLLRGGDNIQDIVLLDLTKPLSATDLVKLQKFAKAAPDKVDKVYSQTDNAIQQAQIAETVRNNKADQYLKGKAIKLDEDKWKASQTGGQTQINGAMERAKRIYADLVKISGEDGVISPDELRKLNVEQLKYLGIEAPQERDSEGKIINQGGFKPLSFTDNDAKGKPVKNSYVIQLKDGNVQVMKNAKYENGRYRGMWDNTKSTNLFNIGTNILNEELKNAGTKELNAYMGVDVIGGITSNTDGGTNTQSGNNIQKYSNSNEKYPLPKGKTLTVKQNGYTYTWNYNTGQYE